MKENFVDYLACPDCHGEITISKIEQKVADRIKTGELTCTKCKTVYPIVSFIPRFVPIENYATNFGLEWNAHYNTQYDSHSGIGVSEKRFFEETKWSRNLKGEFILEVGSGSGRFTEQAATTGAMVVSMDYSFAVEANYKSNGHKDNVFIVQGTIYSMPFKRNFFDKLFCIGVIQHTPEPKKSLLALPEFLKDGGKLVADFYIKRPYNFLVTKYWVRPFTKNKDPKKLYEGVKKYIDFMWPLSLLIAKIPVIGRHINWSLLVADYSTKGLKGDILKEWAYLDTYDMLSPHFDFPQTVKTVKQWFADAKLVDIDVHEGYNGVEGRGTVSRKNS